MSVRFDDSGFQKGIKKLQQKLQELQRELKTNVPILELLPPTFVQRHSTHPSLEALLEANGIQTAEEFQALSTDDRDRLIRENTDFSTWDEMLKTGGEAWLQRKINQAGLG